MSLSDVLSPDADVSTVLARRGINRRQLVKFCSAMLATLAMPDRYLAQMVQAVGKAKKPVLLWLQFQDCTGCSESMLRSSHPDVGEVVLELLSWEYHEVIMAGAGKQADAVGESLPQRRGHHRGGGLRFRRRLSALRAESHRRVGRA
jgi:hydrogenase small subunit